MTFFDILWWILLILYVPACIGLIVIVLLQKGKGTSFAGAFGVGAGSETVFGPRASQTLPVRLTYAAAATFMVIALVMSIISGKIGKGSAPELVEGASATISAPKSLLDKGVGGVGFTDETGAAVTIPGESTQGANAESTPRLTSEDIRARVQKHLEEAGMDVPANAPSVTLSIPEASGAAADAPGESTDEETP